jgi:hypothetical protein
MYKLIGAFLSVMMCPMSCVSEQEYSTDLHAFKQIADTLKQERSIWEYQSFQTYSFTQIYRNPASGGPAISIMVNGQEEPYIELVDPSLDWNDELIKLHVLEPTISDIYTYLDEIIQEDAVKVEKGTIKRIEVIIIYNERYHYPEYIHYWVVSPEGRNFTLNINTFTLPKDPVPLSGTSSNMCGFH